MKGASAVLTCNVLAYKGGRRQITLQVLIHATHIISFCPQGAAAVGSSVPASRAGRKSQEL